MKCLRIHKTNIETGKSLLKVHIPLTIIRIVAQFLPPRIFELLEQDIDGEVGKETVQAIYQMLLEVDKKRDGEIENGIIIDIEEYNEEFKRMEHSIVFIE